MEPLESPFFWRDLHWKLDKSELLAQAKNWNIALQQYCLTWVWKTTRGTAWSPRTGPTRAPPAGGWTATPSSGR
jgi:hypothetical protein